MSADAAARYAGRGPGECARFAYERRRSVPRGGARTDDRRALGGACGDLGTRLPRTLAAITVAGLARACMLAGCGIIYVVLLAGDRRRCRGDSVVDPCRGPLAGGGAEGLRAARRRWLPLRRALSRARRVGIAVDREQIALQIARRQLDRIGVLSETAAVPAQLHGHAVRQRAGRAQGPVVDRDLVEPLALATPVVVAIAEDLLDDPGLLVAVLVLIPFLVAALVGVAILARVAARLLDRPA